MSIIGYLFLNTFHVFIAFSHSLIPLLSLNAPCFAYYFCSANSDSKSILGFELAEQKGSAKEVRVWI